MEGLEDGWAALRAGHWAAAYQRFSAEVAAHATPSALEGLSWAAWWLDDAEALFQAREQAFQGYRDAGDNASAARMATWLAADHLDFHGSLAVAGGWLSRADRLLEPLEPNADHGWLAFHRGFIADIKGRTSEAEADAMLAAETGRRFGVPDLEMLGLALRGMILVSSAKVREGMQSLDEASAIALAGEAEIPISAAWTCCFLVTACTRILDFERAFEWCDRIAAFAERYGSRYMLGFCHAEYAQVHLWRGRWAEAEASLLRSIDAYEASRPSMAGGPLTLLAELRRRQGSPAQSRLLLERADVSDGTQLCYARLALDRGNAALARDLAQRVARNVSADGPLARLPALELLTLAQLSGSELDHAAETLHELRGIAHLIGTPAMCGRMAHLTGMLAAARGDPEAAKLALEDAVDRFDRCRAPYDAALSRVELAGTLASLGRKADAQREAQQALDCLRELGAAMDIRRTQALAIVAERPATASAGISPRETEVLRLLAAGLTNRQISERLFISEHTVHRHVTSILRKLNLPSRTAAAAHAVRIGLAAPHQP